MNLPENEIRKMWNDYRKEKRQDIRNVIIMQYLSLAKYTAERIWARLPHGVELDDLIDAGIFGLMDAIEAFDLDRGVKFETYCIPRIRGAILDELRSLDWVPRLVRLRSHKLRKAYKDLSENLNREPTEKELAKELGLSIDEYYELAKETVTSIFVSLDKNCFDSEENKAVKEIDIIENKKQEDPTIRIQKQDLKELITKGLSKKERLVILLYYYEEMTMKEIGLTLNISESRVSQMHANILLRLQTQLNKRKEEFVPGQ